MKKAKYSAKTSHKPQIKHDKKTDKSVEIMGVNIFGTRKSEVLRKIWLQRKEMLHVATVNPEYIMEARVNPNFKNVLNKCTTVADGHGIVWGLRLLSVTQTAPVERINGTHLVEDILLHASENEEKVFLLGGARGVAERASSEMSKKYPGLQMSWYEGAKAVKQEKNEESSVTIAKINAICPDYLLVAYGSPYQDLWIEENRPYLRVRVAMGVGGVFDEWAGVVARCPDWIDRIGMKWLWRFVHEPKRWRRILRVGLFGLLVMYHKLID